MTLHRSHVSEGDTALADLEGCAEDGGEKSTNWKIVEEQTEPVVSSNEISGESKPSTEEHTVLKSRLTLTGDQN